MPRQVKRKLAVVASTVAFTSLVVAFTYAQLRYQETELEWHTMAFGRDKIRLLLPVGWRNELRAVSLGSGDWILYEGPVQQPRLPNWLRRLFGHDSQVHSDEIMVCNLPMKEWPEPGKEYVQIETNGKVTLLSTLITYKDDGGRYACIRYARTNKRIFDATHKRICESVQLAQRGGKD